VDSVAPLAESSEGSFDFSVAPHLLGTVSLRKSLLKHGERENVPPPLSNMCLLSPWSCFINIREDVGVLFLHGRRMNTLSGQGPPFPSLGSVSQLCPK